MKSKLLESIGLFNYTSGTEYNFRYRTVGSKVKDYMEDLLKKNNLNPDMIYSALQVHSNIVEDVNCDKSEEFIYGKIIKSVDGLITDKSNIALVTKFADCTPVILFDPINKVQASVHSGWRGTKDKISEVAINKLVKEYNCKIENIYAFVGPSVDSELYEVGSEVYNEFSHFKNRDLFFNYKGNRKFLLDMKSINKSILLENGLLNKNIEVSTENTLSNRKFHSARRDAPDYGLNMTITMIK